MLTISPKHQRRQAPDTFDRREISANFIDSQRPRALRIASMGQSVAIQKQIRRLETGVAEMRQEERFWEAYATLCQNHLGEAKDARVKLERAAEALREILSRPEPESLEGVLHFSPRSAKHPRTSKQDVIEPHAPALPQPAGLLKATKPRRVETKQARAWAIIHALLITCKGWTAHRLDIANRVIDGGVLADEARAFRVFENLLHFYKTRGLLTTDYKGNHTLTQLGSTVKDEYEFVHITKAVEP